jgi:hypothetical protein
MSEQVEDFLEHHGVVGMKWGKHKAGSGGSDGNNRKQAVRAFRKEAYKNAGNNVKTHKARTAGQLAAGALIGGPVGLSVVTGAKLSRAAGYSKGKSAVIGLLGGYGGGMLAIEVAARKSARGEE